MNESLELVLGSGGTARRVAECADKLLRFQQGDEGYAYLIYQPTTPPDRVVPEDLAVTLAFNSQATGLAFRSLMERAHLVDLARLPDSTLEETSDSDRSVLATVLAAMAAWPGFKASVATKLMHKKRPKLIPVLDNRAIFEAYLDPRWPGRPTVGESVADLSRIRGALDSLAHDLTRPENADVWPALHHLDPDRTRIEILDMVWWIHFRDLEPLKKRGPANNALHPAARALGAQSGSG